MYPSGSRFGQQLWHLPFFFLQQDFSPILSFQLMRSCEHVRFLVSLALPSPGRWVSLALPFEEHQNSPGPMGAGSSCAMHPAEPFRY